MTKPINGQIRKPDNKIFADRPQYLRFSSNGGPSQDSLNWENKKSELRRYFNENILSTVIVKDGKRDLKDLKQKWIDFLAKNFAEGNISEKQRDVWKHMFG